MASLEGAIGGGRDRERPVGRAADVRCARRRRRPHRGERPALRRHAHAARRVAAPLRHRHHVRRQRRPRRVRRRDQTEHEGRVHRGRRQPVGVDCRPRRARRRRPRRRSTARRRRHARDALPVPADRARRRHRAPLRDEVHRRPRHVDRRCRRRVGTLRLGQRALPPDDRTGCRRTAGCGSGRTSPSTPSARSCGSSSCATSARACRRSTPSSCSSGSRRCRCGWSPRHERQGRRPVPRLARPACHGCGTPGLPDSPFHERAKRYLPKGPGAVFAFGVKGGRAAGRRSSSRWSCAATWPTSATPARW